MTLPLTYPNAWNVALLPGAVPHPTVPAARLMQKGVTAAAAAIGRVLDAVNRVANMAGPGMPPVVLIAEIQAVANLMV